MSKITPFLIDSVGAEALALLDIDELDALAASVRKLLDRIEEQREYLAAPVGRQFKRYQFKQDGPTYYAEGLVGGVLINPALPENFDNTPNDARSQEELARWWLRPFVVVNRWEDEVRHIHAHQEWLKQNGDADLCRPDLAAYIEEQRAQWFKFWPEGSRYEARCLDGGAWDRSSNWGMFGSLAEALGCINERCSIISEG